MTLSEYIRKTSPAVFAKQFEIEERVAVSYMYEARKPKPELAARIVAQTPLKWEDIYGSQIKSVG